MIKIVFSGRPKKKNTIIGDDVWIGHRVVIMEGVTIASGVIVAAGSVVTKNICDCEIYGGVPAVFIKHRFKSLEEKNYHLLKISKKDISNIPPV